LVYFVGVQREVFTDFQIHPVYFRQVTPSRQSVILRIRLDLTKPFDLLLKVTNSLQRCFKFLIVFNHQ